MQIIPHTDRLDYVCAMTNNYAYVRAVEKLVGVTIPERGEYIRTIVAEVQRIVGHLFWLGTQALDIGAMTVFFWTFREREVLLDFFEQLCGARLTLNYYRIGGGGQRPDPGIGRTPARLFEDVSRTRAGNMTRCCKGTGSGWPGPRTWRSFRLKTRSTSG